MGATTSLSLRVMEVVTDYQECLDKNALDLIAHPDPNPGGTDFWRIFRGYPGWLGASADIVDLTVPLTEAGYRKDDYGRSYSVTIPRVAYQLLTTLILPMYPEQVVLTGKDLDPQDPPEKLDLMGFSPIPPATGPEIVLVAPDRSKSDIQVLPSKVVREIRVQGATKEASDYFLRNSQYVLDQGTLEEVLAAFPGIRTELGITDLSQLRPGQFLKWSGILQTPTDDFPEWLKDLDRVRSELSENMTGEEKYFFPTESYLVLKKVLRGILTRKKR